MKDVFEEIFNHINSLEIIDTHEHLPYKEEAREKDTDVLKEYLAHYFNRDLVSAGLPTKDMEKVINNKLPLMERWKIAEPSWEASRYTGYGRSLDIAVKKLYGIDKICGDTIEELNEAFLKSLEPGHFLKVLKDICKIKISLLDNNTDCDKTFFRSVYRLDNFVYPTEGEDIRFIEKESGIRIASFDNWLEACEIILDKVFDKGVVALKSGLAYWRTLNYERVTKSEAESEFNKIFKIKHHPNWENPTFVPGKKFQDYMMHFILNLANKRNLTFQFHTGLLEGNGNNIHWSDPALLSNLFLEYPDVDFDIFHIGYPYEHVLSAIAKMFSNVYIDMCWAHIISPTASINALVEYMDAVPLCKISAFGGDYVFIDGVVGHCHLAKVDVSKALEIKVKEGLFDIDKAKEVAEMFFYKNPMRIFKLEGKL